MTQVWNRDCMEAMKEFPDKFFDLAIVDPPYGIGESSRKSYHPNAKTTYTPKEWDTNVPHNEYFVELERVSKNRIIWGGNYFDLGPCTKPIIWDKQQPDGIDQAMFEFAWQSQTSIQAKIFRFATAAIRYEMEDNSRIHPTQKPIALYKWLLKNYAKEGDKILDTHLGSGSSRIAADQMGFDFWGYELDNDYFEASVKRFNQYKSQLTMF